MTNFNFDFSALPAAPVRGGVEPELVSVLAALVNAAPRALGIKEIIAVAVASGIEVPAETTVRTYLNRAADDGRISKPTRQTYAAAGPNPASVPGLDAAPDEEDPLAGL